MTDTTPANPTDAPVTVAEPPDRPVVVYDGECPFCLRQVAKFKRRDDRDTFEFVPRQAEGLEERFPKLAHGNFNSGMRLVNTDGRIDVGPDAVYGIARRLRGYRRAAWLYRVPGLRSVFRGLYWWVARNRKKLGVTCDDGACEV